MPTLEFFGYVDDQRRDLERRIRMRLRDEPFRGDCVFVNSSASKVLDYEGREQPFVRVSTRSDQRAERFKVLLGDLCDLELVKIQFQRMGGNDG